MKRTILLIILFLFLAGILIGFGAGFFYPQEKQSVSHNKVVMVLPAVRGDGEGMTANLTTIAREGEGRVLVSLNEVLAGVETQSSARTAAQVASNFTGMDLSNVDLIYTIEANASSIDGPSAGASFAISTIAALKGEEINNSVMMTGTIGKGGVIGKASGLMPKIEASRKAGAKLFLVPEEQDLDLDSQKTMQCETFGGVEYCRIDYVEQQNFSIPLERINNIAEAWGFFE